MYVKPSKTQGPHATGKDVSPTASRRDNHPGKKAGKAEHEKLIADQRIVADSLGDTFPKHSTGGRNED
jgi:hypothetical protein